MNKFKFIAEELINQKRRSRPPPTKASSNGKLMLDMDISARAWWTAIRAALLALAVSSAIVFISVIFARLL